LLSTPWPWLAGAVLAVGGFVALRATFGIVTSAWDRATREARGGAGGGEGA